MRPKVYPLYVIENGIDRHIAIQAPASKEPIPSKSFALSSRNRTRLFFSLRPVLLSMTLSSNSSLISRRAILSSMVVILTIPTPFAVQRSSKPEVCSLWGLEFPEGRKVRDMGPHSCLVAPPLLGPQSRRYSRRQQPR